MTTALELDRMYEAETDKLIEEHFGAEETDAHVVEAFRDVEIAIRKLAECRDWLNEACGEGIPDGLEYRIGSYYDTVDQMVVDLRGDLEKWKKRGWE